MKKNILILSDDTCSVGCTTEAILEYRYNIIRTDDPNKALDRLSQRDIDLAIINARISGNTICTETLKKINLLYTALPIIVIAESEYKDRKQEFIEAGATEVVDIINLRLKEMRDKVANILNTED